MLGHRLLWCLPMSLGIAALITAAAFFASQALAQDQAVAVVKWRYDYQQARKEATERKLPIFIDFYTTWCIRCKDMDNGTFRDPQIISILNERFIPLKVDGDVEVSLKNFLRIEAYPTFVTAGFDGKILQAPIIGFRNAPELQDLLLRVLANTSEPEWMVRDHLLAVKLVQNKEYSRAISLLKNIVEDGKNRPVQDASRRLMQELEVIGQARLTLARDMFDRGQMAEAIEVVNDAMRTYAGLQAARDSVVLLNQFMQAPGMRGRERAKRAQELLVQAQSFYKSKEFIPCLDRCEVLMSTYGDLAEGQEAYQISSNLKNDPEWLQSACDVMADRLGNMYLALAESWMRKGQPDRARLCLERVIRNFPNSRHAESAQMRLTQITGIPRPAAVDSASTRP